MSPIWKSVGELLRKRSKTSWCRNAEHLRAEDLAETGDGWVDGPYDICHSGNIDILGKGDANGAFRLGVCQYDKLRACDDLRHNMVNLATSVLTPIPLPSWGRIAQMSKEVHNSNPPWVFPKSERNDAYKHLPLDPQVSESLFRSHPPPRLWVVGGLYS